MSPHIDVFMSDKDLISKLGESNAYLVWVMGMYLYRQDLETLASESLTDGFDDKKIDFINYDVDTGKIIFAQGYYAKKHKDTAPANKASDLNTASAWLMSGDISTIPSELRSIIEECRRAISENEIVGIEFFYVHNLPESINVARELQTAASHLKQALGDNSGINVSAKELGIAQIEFLFNEQDSHISVKSEISCPAQVQYKESGPNWNSYILSVPGSWLYDLYTKHGDSLFSANYRGFLGVTKRKRINSGIRATAELKPDDFWVFNNGITLLTFNIKESKENTTLSGISIINGAQTTGSIASVDISHHDLRKVRVLCRIIQCTDPDTISDIVKYNNTQNEITTWDQYSHDPEQTRIENEFGSLGYIYSRKRGYVQRGANLGVAEVAQPLIAFRGRYQDANRGKNIVFNRKELYRSAFSGKKARHILFVYTLAKAIDEKRIVLKDKSNKGTIMNVEEIQLNLLRNLRFKYFFMAIMAKSLEIILGKRVDIETVAFLPDVADSKTNSIISLAAKWTPIVENVMALLSSRMNKDNFGSQISDADEATFKSISDDVNGLLYTIRENDKFMEFAKLTADS